MFAVTSSFMYQELLIKYLYLFLIIVYILILSLYVLDYVIRKITT